MPGYTFKGIYKELQKHLGSSVQNYIVAARTAQGYEDWHNSSRDERLDVVSRWQAIQVEIEKERQLARHGGFHGHHCYLKATIEALEEKKRHSAEKKRLKRGLSSDTEKSPRVIPTDHPFVGRPREPKNTASTPDSGDFEEAIKTAVAATSRGNPEEDAMIERAIRTTVTELQNASKDGDSGDAIQRAIQASVAEAAQTRQDEQSNPTAAGSDEVGDNDEQLKTALLLSLQENTKSDQPNPLANADFDDSGIDTDDDENIKAAIQRSKAMPIADPPVGSPKEEDLRKVIELSKKEHDQDHLSKSKTEEEIVLEYVKKQSLAEEQHKRAAAARGT